MKDSVLQKELHHVVDTSDEKLLHLMYALAKEYNDVGDNIDFTEEDIKQFNLRRENRINGNNKTYIWEDAKKIITGKAI